MNGPDTAVCDGLGLPGQLFTAIRRAVEIGFGGIIEQDRDLLMARAKLVREVPEVRARALLDHERSVEVLREILAERCGGRADEFELKVTSAVICTAMEAAMAEWLASGGKADLMKLVGRALDIAGSGACVQTLQAKRKKASDAGRVPQAPARRRKRGKDA